MECVKWTGSTGTSAGTLHTGLGVEGGEMGESNGKAPAAEEQLSAETLKNVLGEQIHHKGKRSVRWRRFRRGTRSASGRRVRGKISSVPLSKPTQFQMFRGEI